MILVTLFQFLLIFYLQYIVEEVFGHGTGWKDSITTMPIIGKLLSYDRTSNSCSFERLDLIQLITKIM